MRRCLLLFMLCAIGVSANQDAAVVDSFEMIWTTLRDHYWDASMHGLNWQQVHDTYLPKVKAASSLDEARRLMNEMVHQLPSSHLELVPGELYGEKPGGHSGGGHMRHAHGGPGSVGISVAYIDSKVVVEQVEAGSSSAAAGVHPGWIIEAVDGDSVRKPLEIFGDAPPTMIPSIMETFLSGPIGSKPSIEFIKGDGSRAGIGLERRTPTGKLVQFGNLPPLRVIAEHRSLAGGAGYIRLNIFLDPVSVMPEFEQAITDLRKAPGIVLDLRGNPGGVASMGVGIAGWFVSDDEASLGTMIKRSSKVPMVINPRVEPYAGKLAVLVNSTSASTSEFLAQGLKDLGRARIFGTPTAGMALPSDIIELPDGDRFEYPEANYKSAKGRVLEGNGVELDEVVPPTIPALLQGHDLALESAMKWIAVPQ